MTKRASSHSPLHLSRDSLSLLLSSFMASSSHQSPPFQTTIMPTFSHHQTVNLASASLPSLPCYHFSSTSNTARSITETARTAVDQLNNCEQVETGNRNYRLLRKSTGPNVSRESKRTKQSKRSRVGEAGENPGGYVHVRARRGQATDSHSLAERIRREKINDRMRLLQRLVPGCQRITGKALMLDEIINYVQSLQNQVEFLSMRIASLSPTVYDLGMDMGDPLPEPQKINSKIPSAVPPEQGTCHIQPPEAANNYSILGRSSPFLLHGQGPVAYSQFQIVDGGSMRFASPLQ